MTVDMAAYRRAYQANGRAYDPAWYDQRLVESIAAVEASMRSERAKVIAARNIIHEHWCPNTSWRCVEKVDLARHRALFRAQAVAMLDAIRAVA